jgi:hypothetical protein
MNIPFLDKIVKIEKEKLDPPLRPMAFIMAKDKKVTICMINLDKQDIQMTLYMLKELHKSQEIVLINDGWIIVRKDINEETRSPSECEDKKEAIVISYFSKEIIATHILVYERLKKGIKIIDENRCDNDSQYCRFNPFTVTESQFKSFQEKIK